MRGFSIFLILIFGLGPLSALVDGTEDASLPQCCRRHGAHHCEMAAHILAMRARQAIDPAPAFSVPLTCPNYPGSPIAMLMPTHAVRAAQAEAVTGWTAMSQIVLPPYAPVVSAPLRVHAGRGPPAITPS